jgi:hypothetical protein
MAPVGEIILLKTSLAQQEKLLPWLNGLLQNVTWNAANTTVEREEGKGYSIHFL